MKRTILFRGNRVDNGEWVEGSLYETIYNTYIIQKHDETRTALNAISVIPETIGQFTGLTDKNGKMIFEGDVVKQTGKVNNGSSGAIMVENMRIAVCEINSAGTIMFLSNYRSDIHSSSYEVIGSIHDNPKLS